MEREIRIKSNYYRKVGQVEGNGLNGSYAEGVLKNGSTYLTYPKLGVFYLEVDKLIVDRINIEPNDLLSIENPIKWLKYANFLLDKYEYNL